MHDIDIMCIHGERHERFTDNFYITPESGSLMLSIIAFMPPLALALYKLLVMLSGEVSGYTIRGAVIILYYFL